MLKSHVGLLCGDSMTIWRELNANAAIAQMNATESSEAHTKLTQHFHTAQGKNLIVGKIGSTGARTPWDETGRKWPRARQ